MRYIQASVRRCGELLGGVPKPSYSPSCWSAAGSGTMKSIAAYRTHSGYYILLVGSCNRLVCDRFAHKLLQFLRFFESRLHQRAEKGGIWGRSSGSGNLMKLLGALCDGACVRHYTVPGSTHNVLEVDGSAHVHRFDVVRGKFFEVVIDEILHGGIIVVTYS